MKKSWWQRFRSSTAHTQANIVCTIVIAIATCAYAFIAYRQLQAIDGQLHQMSQQLPEIQKSADAAKKTSDTTAEEFELMKQQMIFEKSARVRTAAGILFGQNIGPRNTLTFTLRNDGHELAANVSADFTLTERAVEGERVVKRYGMFSLNAPYPLDPVQDTNYQGMNVNPHAYSLPTPIAIPEPNLTRILNTEDFLEIRGTTKYFDGFSDQTENFCLRFATFTEGATTTYNSEFSPCADFTTVIARLHEYEEQETRYQQKLEHEKTTQNQTPKP